MVRDTGYSTVDLSRQRHRAHHVTDRPFRRTRAEHAQYREDGRHFQLITTREGGPMRSSSANKTTFFILYSPSLGNMGLNPYKSDAEKNVGYVTTSHPFL